MSDKNSTCELKSIYDTLVSVCNAIVSVINVDITIVDSDLNRITGTGRYVASIGEKLNRNCIFAYALEKGEEFIIENPRLHEACSKCGNKESCREYAQVCCPIKVADTVIGIMGLIAFDEKQKEIIVSNKENLLEFISRMSDLIASKIEENRKAQKVDLMARELEILVDSMDMGVVSTDENGGILRYNLIASEIFNISRGGGISNIAELIDGISIPKMKENQCYIYNSEFSYRVKGTSYRGFYNAKPIVVEDKLTGFIFTFNRMNEIIKVVNDVSSTDMTITFDDIIGVSGELVAVKEYAHKIAAGRSTVLIQGESGTGKELFARAIHHASDRRTHPFVAVNCAAIPENLIESELFGYEEGAFTGARKGGKIGKFELSSKGTIFLDEIGDMPINLQTKLLRVLQDKVIERVGGNTPVPVDVRIIAASNKPLEEKVREKEFREDLFYRINVIPIYLPPLRERVEDVEILANSFLHKYNHKLGRAIVRMEPAAAEVLKSYKWPGNVRELENVVEYAVNMAGGNSITVNDLPRRLKAGEADSEVEQGPGITNMKALEKREMEKALELYGGSSEGVEKAAKALGMSRATMYRKIKSYGIRLVSE